MNASISLSDESAIALIHGSSEYETIRRVVELITEDFRDRMPFETIAGRLSVSPAQLQTALVRWSGLSPKAFLETVRPDYAKSLVGQNDMPLLEAVSEACSSGPERPKDFHVTHEAMPVEEWKARGKGLTIRYGFHPCPFGTALVMTTARGLAGLAFNDAGGDAAAFEDMAGRWPKATYVPDQGETATYAARIFDPQHWQKHDPLRLLLIGSEFQVRVWERLLEIPLGKAVIYSKIASDIGQPTASRAVGAAVGANPISFVVPCHRALGKSGALTGYHWGLTRKRAMLSWEAGHSQLCGG